MASAEHSDLAGPLRFACDFLHISELHRKPCSSQIYYVDLSDGDSAVGYQQEEPGILSRLLTSLNHGIYAVVEYFD